MEIKDIYKCSKCGSNDIDIRDTSFGKVAFCPKCNIPMPYQGKEEFEPASVPQKIELPLNWLEGEHSPEGIRLWYEAEANKQLQPIVASAVSKALKEQAQKILFEIKPMVSWHYYETLKAKYSAQEDGK